MKYFRSIALATTMLAATVATSAPVEAQEKFSFELVPYVWASGLDADVTELPPL